jgi:hypothetical protein
VSRIALYISVVIVSSVFDWFLNLIGAASKKEVTALNGEIDAVIEDLEQQRLNPRNLYYQKKQENEQKDGLIKAKAISLGIPAALADIGLAKIKADYPEIYKELDEETIRAFTIEQLQGIMSKLQKPKDENLGMWAFTAGGVK